MSLLVKNSGGSLSDMAIDADKNWQGRLIKNLGRPVDDADALRKQDAILKELLTEPGQLLYASGPQAPAALAPETGDKYLKAGSPPVWAEVPISGGGYWEKAGESVLATPVGTIAVSGIAADYEILWIQFMSTWSNGWDIKLKFNDSGLYDYSRHSFAGAYSRTAFDNVAEITLISPGGEGQVFYQFQGFIFQRLAHWRKTFTGNWYYTNSADAHNSFHVLQGYWNDQISRVTGIRFQNGGSFNAQARLIVLGAR